MKNKTIIRIPDSEDGKLFKTFEPVQLKRRVSSLNRRNHTDGESCFIVFQSFS